MHSRFLLAALLALAACGPNSSSVTPMPPMPAQEVDIRLLSIPPQDVQAIYALLDQMQQESDKGRPDLAKVRAHYLLDLFDTIRFGGDEKSRSLLAKVLGWPVESMRGPGATQAAAELLVLEFDHILERDRQDKLGAQGRTIANFDNTPPKARKEVFQRILELKRIITTKGPLSDNATLRLFGYCKNAMLDAKSLGRRDRRIAISHCLYPLYAANPEPYFADKAEHRPPPPEMRSLVAPLQTLLTESNGRLAPTIAAQANWLEEFASGSSFRTTIAASEALLPSATRVLPYDDAPLVGDNLRSALQSDGRGIAALALPASAKASDTIKAATFAANVGAHTLAVVVVMKQKLNVPKGDYWSGKLERDGKTVERAGEIPLSLARIGSSKESGQNASTRAKASAWDPTRAALELHLLISPASWQLVSPLGSLATIDTRTDSKLPQDALRQQLSLLRLAFPDEDGLILVPDNNASHAALIGAAQAARHDSQGKPLFSSLALASKGPKSKKGNAFRRRVERRSAAKVSVKPATAAAQASVARLCYLALQDKGKAPSGQVHIEADGKGGIKLRGGAKSLQNCADRAFRSIVESGKISAISVTFGSPP